MLIINGKYNTAVCFCETIEEKAAEQIRTVCSQPFLQGNKIRIMPDVHAGKGCTIGTTMTIRDKIVPAMVGVDIGCGMETVKLREKEISFAELDNLIRREIPCGREIRQTPHPFAAEINLKELRCAEQVNLVRAERSIGTLGGGNHFIEVDKNAAGELYLVIHSGSRHIGREVARYYQEQGKKALWGGAKWQIRETIARLKAEGRYREIERTIKALHKEHPLAIPPELVYVEGELFADYIHDMKIIQNFAMLNRKVMAGRILNGMNLTPTESFTTIHNYVDTDAMILRKGAVSAKKGEKLLIPLNMRDGSLICIGKGNSEWNDSAPHGAGRLMSRKAAFANLSMEAFVREMQNVYTTCVTQETLDESPMAYKSMYEIIRNIEPTADVAEQIRPVYNFKATDGI